MFNEIETRKVAKSLCEAHGHPERENMVFNYLMAEVDWTGIVWRNAHSLAEHGRRWRENPMVMNYKRSMDELVGTDTRDSKPVKKFKKRVEG